MRRRKVWRHEHVVDAVGPHLLLRTYVEQTDIRGWLSRIRHEIDIERACDVGAGYGRLTPVLTEFAPHVVAFEREEHFVNDMRHLLPHIEVQHVETLSQLAVPSRSFQFVLVFTVLQHLTDDEFIPVVRELQRIVAHQGYVLLCEATDISVRYNEDASPEGGVTIGRSIEQYQSIFNPLILSATAPRRVEPTYHQGNTGTYMLFGNTLCKRDA